MPAQMEQTWALRLSSSGPELCCCRWLSRHGNRQQLTASCGYALLLGLHWSCRQVPQPFRGLL